MLLFGSGGGERGVECLGGGEFRCASDFCNFDLKNQSEGRWIYLRRGNLFCTAEGCHCGKEWISKYGVINRRR